MNEMPAGENECAWSRTSPDVPPSRLPPPLPRHSSSIPAEDPLKKDECRMAGR